MYRKVYVEVKADFDIDGGILPLSIVWEDGRVYEIDKITNIGRAASLKAGGAGIRYTCIINNKLTYLFLEKSRWFVQAK